LKNIILFIQQPPPSISRAFSAKLKSLLKDLLVDNIFGKVIGYSWVVEFQKRGLPHVHLLLILHEKDKPKTTADYDAIVSAELPDKDTCPLAYSTVVKSMIHGPCGAINPNSPCMKDGQCSKGYPRPLSSKTVITEDGYPSYRRRQGSSFMLNDIEVDNKWVVPHNLWLATKYDAHLNVEICSSVSAVKYLYKYIHKGHDRAKIRLEKEIQASSTITSTSSSSFSSGSIYASASSSLSMGSNTTTVTASSLSAIPANSGQPAKEEAPRNEIHEFRDMRYLSSPESMWRILAYPLHGHSPAVQRLQVHLPGQHNITFNKKTNLYHAATRNNDSQLMAFFKLNQTDQEAHKYTYSELPEHYTYDYENRKWNKRKRKDVFAIGRIYFVHPKDGERFCLRALLLHVKGPTSFESLRTVQGELCETFRDAALALHLLEDDREWELCLKEAATFKFPRELRHLFAIILVNCAPSQPRRLWDTYATHMIEDILYKARQANKNEFSPRPDEDLKIEATKNALWELDSYLKGLGSSLADFFTMPQGISNSIIGAPSPDDCEKTRDELARLAKTHISALNGDQREIFNKIMTALSLPLHSHQRRLFFIDGPGGTGKSFLYNTLIEQISGILRKNVIVLASSGIAALILHGGRTAHSVFKVPIPVFHDSTCNITRKQQVGSMIYDADIIIWDEAPMMHR
jgi:hypothetical protein